MVSAFREDPFLRDQLYLVDDLRGIRDRRTREALFAEKPKAEWQVTLPPEGLLVVSPEIYRTSHDPRDRDDDFARHYRHNTAWPAMPPNAKWEGVSGPEDAHVFVPDVLEDQHIPLGLLRCLKRVHDRTGKPLVYYHCTMWGGDVETELAWVIDRDQRVYRMVEGGAVWMHSPQRSRNVRTDVLIDGMKAVGVDLASRFFALHEASFHWRRYRLEPGRSETGRLGTGPRDR